MAALKSPGSGWPPHRIYLRMIRKLKSGEYTFTPLLPGMAASLPSRRLPRIEQRILPPASMTGFSSMKVCFSLGYENDQKADPADSVHRGYRYFDGKRTGRNFLS